MTAKHPAEDDTRKGDTPKGDTPRGMRETLPGPLMRDPLSDTGSGAVVRADTEQPDSAPTFVAPTQSGHSHLEDTHAPDIVLDAHVAPQTASDRIAFGFTKAMRFVADRFFAKRYGHRAVVLETVAGVPGMVGGMLQHLSSLRRMKDDEGWIRTLLDEAENERMHLMTFIEIAKPNAFERFVIVAAQILFFIGFSLLYLIHKRTAHRVVGYFEEEAVFSYTQYLAEVDSGRQANTPAPRIAIDYWGLAPDARLRDVIIAVRADEAAHRDMNHGFVDVLDDRRCARDLLGDKPAVGKPPHAAAR